MIKRLCIAFVAMLMIAGLVTSLFPVRTLAETAENMTEENIQDENASTESEVSKNKVENDTAKISIEKLEEDISYEKRETDKDYENTVLENICGEITIDKTIEICGTNIDEYPTFENRNDSLARISNNCANVIDSMKQCYELGTFSEETWSQYAGKVYDYSPNKNQKVEEEELSMLKGFFDIYENTEKNQKMTDEIEGLSGIFADGDFSCQ